MIQIVKYHFTVAEYNRMAQAGILAEDDRVELINGEVFTMSPIGSQHAACVDRLMMIFIRMIGNSNNIRVQGPIELDDYSEPQPDVSILKLRADFYAGHNSLSNDVLLIVEVSDTTLEYDQEVKLPLYAKANIPEVWIVNLPEQTVEIHTEPRDGKFQQRTVVKCGEPLSAKTIAELTFKSAGIFG